MAAQPVLETTTAAHLHRIMLDETRIAAVQHCTVVNLLLGALRDWPRLGGDGGLVAHPLRHRLLRTHRLFRAQRLLQLLGQTVHICLQSEDHGSCGARLILG